MPKNTVSLPDWELVLSSAARLQHILPDAVLVGGTASAIHAEHRFSRDADHVLTDLRDRFDDVLNQLESVAGWKTARVQRPVQILGSLDGIQTGVRQLVRAEPLETQVVNHNGAEITVPTENEILRIKGVLILKRNATRDYLDFVALADHLGDENIACALQPFDRLYPQASGESSLQQLQVQLANALPYDLEETELSEYKNLTLRWHDWQAVKAGCSHLANLIFDQVCGKQAVEQDKLSGVDPTRDIEKLGPSSKAEGTHGNSRDLLARAICGTDPKRDQATQALTAGQPAQPSISQETKRAKRRNYNQGL